MAGRFFTAAALVAAAFVSPALALNNSTSAVNNSTASTFSYSSSTEEVANTPATEEYGKHRFSLLSFACPANTM